MQIRFDKIGIEPSSWKEAPSIGAEALGRSELIELREVDWQGQIRAEGSGFPLAARASYNQTVSCVRCLAPITEPVSTDLQLLVINGPADSLEGEVELSVEDLEILYWPEEVLNTTTILHELLQLNVPLRALCKEDCLGLCPVCGSNRNESTCDCQTTPVDPRWEVLRGMTE